MRFEGKTALITAAANGIGRATADIIAREGGTVVAVDNNQQRLDNAVAELGGRAHGRQCDALDPAQADALIDSVVREFGRIDILVNAVGGSTIIPRPAATVDELTFEEWQQILAFNLHGTFLFTHAVVPAMKREKHGKIVNLASIAGRGLSETSSTAYAAAKGGIIALTRKLSFELGPFGINVNAIAPSLTLSERLQPRWKPDGAAGPGCREAACAAAPHRNAAGPGAGDLLPRIERRGFRHRPDHRRHRGAVRRWQTSC